MNKLVRDHGFEPRFLRSERRVLPLDESRVKLELLVGVKPTTYGLRNRCSVWLSHSSSKTSILEPPTGFEPARSYLQGRCSAS